MSSDEEVTSAGPSRSRQHRLGGAAVSAAIWCEQEVRYHGCGRGFGGSSTDDDCDQRHGDDTVNYSCIVQSFDRFDADHISECSDYCCDSDNEIKYFGKRLVKNEN